MDATHFELRKEALAFYIADFAENTAKAEFIDLVVDIDEAAHNICALYFRYVDEVIRPTLALEKDGSKPKIQHYKIIAFTEFCVLRVQPLQVPGNEDMLIAARYNARLALHIALSLLIDWNEFNKNAFAKMTEEDSELFSFLTEHTTWLTTLDTRYYFPGFSNSQLWRLFHYLVKDRIIKYQ